MFFFVSLQHFKCLIVIVCVECFNNFLTVATSNTPVVICGRLLCLSRLAKSLISIESDGPFCSWIGIFPLMQYCYSVTKTSGHETIRRVIVVVGIYNHIVAIGIARATVQGRAAHSGLTLNAFKFRSRRRCSIWTQGFGYYGISCVGPTRISIGAQGLLDGFFFGRGHNFYAAIAVCRV